MNAGSTLTEKYRLMFHSILAPLSMVIIIVAGLVIVPVGTEPILLAILAGIIFFWILKRKNKGVFPVEVGSFYFCVVFIYCTMPFIAYAINGYEYHMLSDSRLYHGSPPSEEVRGVGTFFILYLSIFSASYLTFRKPVTGYLVSTTLRPSTSIIVVLIGIYLLLEFSILYLKYAATGSVVSEGYRQQYLWANEYPLVVRQIINHMQGIVLAVQIFIVTYLFLGYKKFRFLIAAFLLLKTVALIFSLGARTELTMLLVVSSICYYNYVKAFSLWKVIFVTTVLVVGFLLLGWVRDLQAVSSGSYGIIVPSTEFEALFGNAYDIWSRNLVGGIGAPKFYPFEGIINLIPQQLLPIEKPNLAKWYADTYYPAFSTAGGGLAFGVITESLLSDSPWIAVIWRATFHGFLLAWVYNMFHRAAHGRIQTAIYIWITVLSYQLFRDTTFSLLPKLVFDLLPVVLIVYGIPLLARYSKPVARR